MVIAPHKDIAFSLVELMISMAVIAIMLTAGFSALSMGYNLTGESRDRTRAGQILQTELEAMRTMNWSDMEAMATETTNDISSGGDGFIDFTPRVEFIDTYKDNFTCSRKVTIRDNNEQMDIELIIGWDAYPNYKQEKFPAVFTKGGLNDYYYRAF